MQAQQAILVVSFGTSHHDALTNSIQAIEQDIQKENPSIPVFRAFTSGMILKKLRERDGMEIPDPAAALEQLKQQGVRRVAVQPTHMIPGDEYEKLLAVCREYKDSFEVLRVGQPLLSQPADLTRCVQEVVREYPCEPGTALVLMGHGSESQANDRYCALAAEFAAQGYRHVFLGTVESEPDGEAVLAMVRASGFFQARLAPLMVVAGDHAKNDLAGEEENSWKQMFQRAGIQTECVLRGLGECAGIRKLYCEHLAELLPLE